MKESRLSEAEGPSQKRPLTRFIGIILIVLPIVTAVYLLVGYFAWQSGQNLRLERETVERNTQISHQISLAREDIGQGSYALALRRLEWVLTRKPQEQEASSLKQQLETVIQATSNAVILPTQPPTRAAAEPTPTPGEITNPQTDLDRLQRLANRQAWHDLLQGVQTFQRQFPDYERQNSDQLLFDAYVNYGLTIIEGEQVELGLFYLGQAEKLGDLPQGAQDFRSWAELYVQGIAFYGANWGVASSIFRELCLAAPFYQSSCERLQESLVRFGDQYAFAQDFCPAAEIYREASQYNNGQALNGKLIAATEGCLTATPTPSVPITGTVPFAGFSRVGDEELEIGDLRSC